MDKKLIFVIITFMVFFSGIFSGNIFGLEENKFKEIDMAPVSLDGKKAAIVVAFRNFRDEEYFVPKGILEEAGLKVTTVSNDMGQAQGAFGGKAEVDVLTDDLNVSDFDVIVFVGGSGCLENLDSERSYKIVRAAISHNKILASICISPTILAKAGALKGKKATVWSSALDKGPVRTLESNGAIYIDKPVVQDGNIITANGPAAAKEFAEAIIGTFPRGTH